MYDISTKNVRKGIGFYSTFLLGGLFFLIITFYSSIADINKQKTLDSSTMSNSVRTKSYVDDGVTMYSNIYYFEVNGRGYSCNSSYSSSINPKKDNKEVYYASGNPSVCNVGKSTSIDLFTILFALIPLICVIIAVHNIKKIIKRIKLIKELNIKGKLVKNLPYNLGETSMSVNDVQIKRPVVDYELHNGVIVTLYGDPRHDKKLFDEDGMVDLVIDESNPDNYFIDYEINRLTGNLPSDYYNQS